MTVFISSTNHHIDYEQGNLTLSKEQQIDRYVKGARKEERRRQLRTASKKVGSRGESQKSQRRSWVPHQVDFDDLEVWDDVAEERIMSRDTGERRRAVASIAFTMPEEAQDEAPEPQFDGRRGQVIEISKGLCRVDLGSRVLLCGLRGSLNAEDTGALHVIAVGDEVIISEDGMGGGTVEQILPRRSELARPDTFYTHLRQVIAANIDQLLIVAAWRNPPIWLEMIDRYLVFAQRSNLPAVICINKCDLIKDETEFVAAIAPYQALGYPVIRASAMTGEGMTALRDLLHNRATVLTGLSGVGKSSLVAAVQPGLELRTQDVNDHSGEGRHTTTQATWLKLGEHGAVVDTPGIREFGLAGMSASELTAYFPEFGAQRCRFRDCQHLNEPGCGVRAAVDAGQIAHSRYHSYTLIHSDLQA